MTNAKSIRAKLYNLSKANGVEFQQILFRYIHERLLYRISISEYAHTFILKGGNLMYALQGINTRPTTDVDFLGWRITNDIENAKQIFREICSIDTNDAILFDISSLDAYPINEQNTYEGIRLKLKVSLDTIQQYIQIDIGFGDIVTPKPISLDYPVLLSDMPTPHIYAYTPETVIAEKLQAMMVLAQLNSRMKDFFDIYILMQQPTLQRQMLKSAILQTFGQRNTALNMDSVIFTEAFGNDIDRQKMWQAYLKKIKTDGPDFREVMHLIRDSIRELFVEGK